MIAKVFAKKTVKGVEIDFSTLPTFFHNSPLSVGSVEIVYEIVFTFAEAKPGGYMVKVKHNDNVLQDSTVGTYPNFYPSSELHLVPILWTPTREEGENCASLVFDTIKTVYSLSYFEECWQDTLEVVAFDRKIEELQYENIKKIYKDELCEM